jgi:hypothetical protein
MEKEMKETFGTKEWAAKTVNLLRRGCQHRCRYCYSCADGIRFKRFTAETRDQEVVNERKLKATIRPKTVSLMYPSTHDITPDKLPQHLAYLDKLVAAYPSVLIVSKPHLECIRAICQRYLEYRDKITFRFTIGSANNEVLKFWEPNAPSLDERMDCLKLAYEQGYKTSVSSEPMLDNKFDEVVRLVRPFVNDTIWPGKANLLRLRLKLNGHTDPETTARAEELLGWQSDENIYSLYQLLKDDPLIKWKGSIYKALASKGTN